MAVITQRQSRSKTAISDVSEANAVSYTHLDVYKRQLPVGEVIGAIPVDPVLQAGAMTQSPGWFTLLCPGIAQIHVLMKMRLINVCLLYTSRCV